MIHRVGDHPTNNTLLEANFEVELSELRWVSDGFFRGPMSMCGRFFFFLEGVFGMLNMGIPPRNLT